MALGFLRKLATYLGAKSTGAILLHPTGSRVRWPAAIAPDGE